MKFLPRIVDNWRSAWRWWSIRFSGLAIASEAAWATLPPEALHQFVSDAAQQKITAALVLAAIIGRMVDQGAGSAARK